MPFGPATTNPELARVTVPVPLLYPGTETVMVTWPEEPRALTNVPMLVVPAESNDWIVGLPTTAPLPSVTRLPLPELIVIVSSMGSAGAKVMVMGTCRFAPTVALLTVIKPEPF